MVTTTTSLTSYVIASLGQAFTPGFPIQNTSDFVLTYTNATTFADTVLTLNVDYFVTGTFTAGVCAAPTVTLEGTGLHYAIGGKLTVQRLNPETQPTNKTDGTKYLASTDNNAWDWLCYSIQALNDRISRALLVPASSTAQSPISFANRLGKLAGWDNNGNFTTYYLNTSGVLPFPATLNASFPFYFPSIGAASLSTVPTINAPVPCACMLIESFSSSFWQLISSSASVGSGVIQPADNSGLRWVRVG